MQRSPKIGLSFAKSTLTSSQPYASVCITWQYCVGVYHSAGQSVFTRVSSAYEASLNLFLDLLRSDVIIVDPPEVQKELEIIKIEFSFGLRAKLIRELGPIIADPICVIVGGLRDISYEEEVETLKLYFLCYR